MQGSKQAHDGASVRVAFDVPCVKGVFVCDVSACAVCWSYSLEHSANNAAVQGLSPLYDHFAAVLTSAVRLLRFFRDFRRTWLVERLIRLLEGG